MADDALGFFEGLDQAHASAASGPAAAGETAWGLLRDLTDLLNSPLDRFDQVVSAALEAMIGITGADRGLLLLQGDNGLEIKLGKNLALDDLPADERRVSRSVLDEVARTGVGIAIPDLSGTSRFADSASVAELKLLSILCVPLVQRTQAVAMHGEAEGAASRGETDQRSIGGRRAEKVIGAIYVDSRSVTTSFQEEDLPLFQAVANVVTTSILRADDFRRATTDTLTGLASRPFLERRLADELHVHDGPSGGHLSLLLIDIDQLHEVNRSRGYAAGDRVIQTVGRVLRRRTRLVDTAGRYGGEEFLVVLPDTGELGAEEVGRKLLVALQREGVQVSVGVATRAGNEGAAALIRRCDQALSQAKAEGGGRTRAYNASSADILPVTDKLAGIFTGEPATVYRNVLMLLESIPKIHQATTVDRVFDGVLEAVIDLARAERGYLVVEERGEVRARLGLDWRRRVLPDAGFDRQVARDVIQTSEVFVDDHGVLCVPIAARGDTPRGAIYLEAREHGFAEGAAAFVQAFARQGEIAVENARLLEENRTYARKTEKLMRALEDQRERVKKELAETADAFEPAATGRSNVVGDCGLEIGRYGQIIGQSEVMRKVFDRLDRVTRSDAVSVFIHGESGTGKELIAKAVHFNGPRRKMRFVAENCAAMSESLLESELFGYVKGAFTGAHGDRKGLFEQASGGTLFLDEVGDMTLNMQTKLLRVLQEGEIRRVGGEHMIKVDVRMVSASNKDIQRMVEEGSFREDLYYRLNVVRIDLPPLRDRRSDVPLLVDHFLRADGKLARPMVPIDDAALDLLCRYPFPGNIRELRNVIERAKILAEGPTIDVEAILLDSDWHDRGPLAPSRSGAADSPALSGSLRPGGLVGVTGRGGGGLGLGGLGGIEPDGQREASARVLAGGSSAPSELPAGSTLAKAFYALNDRQRRLVDHLQTYGSIKNREYYEVMGVSKSTGWRDLKGLINRNIIRVSGRGKGSVYSIDPACLEVGTE